MNAIRLPLILLLLLYGTIALADVDKDTCPGSDAAVTVPAPVDTASVLEAMAALKTAEGKPALELSSDVVNGVHDIFDTSKVKTKMEQFYSLLYLIYRQALPKANTTLALDAKTVREVLLRSAVFTDPSIPARIEAVSLLPNTRYEVIFDRDRTAVPLNKGEGFYLFRNGLCQHARELIFQKRFAVTLEKNSKGNLVAKEFKGVDLFGAFGNRGVVDVDINYVELRAVEFYRGTPNGKVTAYVSKEEFKKNNHGPLLKIITRLVPDKSVQPIDW